MPRYFFNYEGASQQTDEHGRELGNDEDARLAAIGLVCDLLADRQHGFDDRPRWRVTVLADNQQVIFAITTAAESLKRSAAIDAARGYT